MEPFTSLRQSHTPPGKFIGEGIKVVRRMLAFSKVEKLLLTPKWHEELKPRLTPDIEVRVASMQEVKGIVGYQLHQGAFAMARIPDPPAWPPRGLILALDRISSADNVGAVVRSAVALGADAILVGPETCSPWTRRSVRSSMGAVLRIPIHFTESLVESIRSFDFPSFAAHIHPPYRTLDEVDLSPPSCIVLGCEADGVSPEVLSVCAETVYIPMSQGWDCLNVAASSAVLVHAAKQAALRKSGIPI